MRIAFFTDTYHPAIDGVVRAIDEYSTNLQKLGHEVKIFAPSPKEQNAKREKVSYSSSIGFAPYPQYRIPYWWNNSLKDVVNFKPDIIHSHAMVIMGIAAKEAAKKIRAPLIGTFHTMLPQAGHYISDTEGAQLWFENVSWKYLKWFYSSGFDKITCPSNYVKEEIYKHGIDSLVLPNPVDVQKFSSKKIDSRAKIWFEKDTIMFLGRIAREKNIDFLIEMARLEEFDSIDTKILIAGDGPYLPQLQKKVKKYSLEKKVEFVGKVDESLLASFYSLASCCIFPSVFETQGLTALEALACSTPVVALEKTAISEFIEPSKNGYVSLNNPKSALDAAHMAIKNKKKLAAGARKTAMEYSADKCTKKLLEIYKGVL